MKKNKTRYAILVMLSLESMSGYDMKKFTKEVLSHFWSESYGQIYTNLKVLLKEGLVVSTEKKEPNKPIKNVYEITDSGMSVLLDWLSEPTEEQIPRNELSLKFFVAPLVSSEVLLNHIKMLREQQQRQLDALKLANEKMIQEVPEGIPHKPYWIIGSRSGILIHEAKLKWCDEAEAFILQQSQK